MITVGIDLGTKTGWAVLDERGERIASGVWDLGAGKPWAERLRKLEHYLSTALELWPHARVAFELVKGHNNTRTAHAWGAYWGVLVLVCGRAGVEPVGVPVHDVKGKATGKRGAKKGEVQAAAVMRWQVDGRPRNRCYAEDEADALWIAECGRVP